VESIKQLYGFFIIMGRHRKNKSEEFIIDNNSETKHPLSEIKIPFWLKATYKEMKDGKPIYAGTSEQPVRYLHYTKDEITKYFQKKGIEIIKFEEIIMKIPDLCEKCHRIGIPKIEEFPNKYDYYLKAGSPLSDESRRQKNEVNRPSDWHLTYDHKVDGKLKKCKIAKFDKNHMIFINPSNRIIELHKHFFPYCAEWMKKLTIA